MSGCIFCLEVCHASACYLFRMLIWLSGVFIRGLSGAPSNQQAGGASLGSSVRLPSASCNLSSLCSGFAAILSSRWKFITFQDFSGPHGVYTSISRSERVWVQKSEMLCCILGRIKEGLVRKTPPNYTQVDRVTKALLHDSLEVWWAKQPISVRRAQFPLIASSNSNIDTQTNTS